MFSAIAIATVLYAGKPGHSDMITAGQARLIAETAKEKAAHVAHLQHVAHVKRLEALKKAEYRKAAAPASAESPVQTASVNPGGGIEGCIIAHESGGDSQVMNGSGHYGLFQFDEQTWVSGGGNPGDFGHASVSEQDSVYNSVSSARGSEPWSGDGCA